MNKKILLSSALALTISLAPISSAMAMDFQIGPPGPRPSTDDNVWPPLSIAPDYTQMSINKAIINSEDSVKVGDPIKFESSLDDRVVNTSAISYSWDFGDGNTSSDSVVSHVFNEPGIYTVKLKLEAWQNPGCYHDGPIKKYSREITKTIIVE